MLLVEMSQNAVVPAGLTKVKRSQRVHRRLSLLGGVGRAVGGGLQEERREEEKLVNLDSIIQVIKVLLGPQKTERGAEDLNKSRGIIALS